MTAQGNLPLTPTFIDGLLLVANGLSDLQVVIDCANCGCDKFAVVGMNHDLHSTLIQWDQRQRAAFSDLRANEMVLGTESRLADMVRETVHDNAPSMVLLLASSTVQLIGSDLDLVAEDLEEELGVPHTVVTPKTFDGDFSDGYAEGLDRVARRLELPASDPREGEVALVGHRFDRGEEDGLGNLREIARLLDALGLRLATALPAGEPLAAAAAGLARAERIFAMPYGLTAARRLGRRLGTEVEEIDIPVGLGATADWLHDLGRRTGREAQAREVVDRELSRHVPRLEWVVRHTFVGRRAALIFDPPLARSFTDALRELGFEVPLVALQTRRKDAAAALVDALAPGHPPPEVVRDPTFPVLEERLRSLHEAGRLDVIVGSGRAREAAKDLPVPYLEIGYPAYLRHALFDAPWMGFRGAMWLADALMNLVRESEFRRSPT